MASPPVDTHDLSTTLLDATIILTVAGAIFVLARLWVRFVSTKAHSWDDYFILGSLVGCLKTGREAQEDATDCV